MAIDDSFDASKAAGRFPRSPRLPVAGFWIRFLAFVVDWILLTGLMYALALVGREAILAAGAWAGRVAAVAIFAYFWLGDGPIGKGRTLGKAILGLRTVAAADGAPLGWRESFLRALILVPQRMWVLYFIDPILVAGGSGYLARIVEVQLANILTLALFLGQILRVAMNPARQGFHDAAAGSLVLGADHADTVWSQLEETAGPEGMARMRLARRSGWVGLIATFVMLSYMSFGPLFNAQNRQNIEHLKRLQQIEDKYGFEVASAGPSKPLDDEKKELPGATERSSSSASEKDKNSASASGNSSAASEKSQTPNGSTTADDASGTAGIARAIAPLERVYFCLKREIDRRPADQIRAEFNQFLDELLAEAEKIQGEGYLTPFSHIPKGSMIVFIHQEYVDLVLFQKGYDVVREERRWTMQPLLEDRASAAGENEKKDVRNARKKGS